MSHDYLQKNEIISYSAVSTISEMKPEDMVDILVHAKVRQVDMIPELNLETKLAAAYVFNMNITGASGQRLRKRSIRQSRA